MKRIFKTLAAVIAMSLVLAGCSSKTDDSLAKYDDLEVGGARIKETTAEEDVPGNETQTEAVTEKEEVKPDDSSVVQQEDLPAFEDSYTAAFCKKLKEGDLYISFDVYDITSIEDTSIRANMVIMEHDGVGYIRTDQFTGMYTDTYYIGNAWYTLSVKDGEDGEVISGYDGTEYALDVQAQVMGGLTGDAEVLSVETFSDGSVGETVEFEVAGEKISYEYVYDKDTGVLTNIKGQSMAINVGTFTEGIDEIEIPDAVQELLSGETEE